MNKEIEEWFLDYFKSLEGPSSQRNRLYTMSEILLVPYVELKDSKMLKKEGQYIFSLKGNQGELCEEVKTYFANEDFKLMLCLDFCEDYDKGHGRIESRIRKKKRPPSNGYYPLHCFESSLTHKSSNETSA